LGSVQGRSFKISRWGRPRLRVKMHWSTSIREMQGKFESQGMGA